jgi:hypothetical protein
LLFQFPEHLNQYVLGREVKLPQSIYSVASTLTGFSQTLRDGSDHLSRLERSWLDWQSTAARGNRGCLAIWAASNGDNPLADGASQISPGVDELVELLTHRSKEPTDNSPMQLFSDKPQVDQLDKRLLQHKRDLFAHLAAEGWQMRQAYRR